VNRQPADPRAIHADKDGHGDRDRDGNPDKDGRAADDRRAMAGVAVGLEVSQWKYLSTDARRHEMHVILTVRVDGTGGGPGGRVSALAEVLVIDCSTSMTWPQEKFRAAKQAASAALRMLPDGTPFAVVQGTESAAMAYPATPFMPRASARLRAEAERAVHGLEAAGGTSIGTWLDLSRQLLAERDEPIRHVLLLTDGRNQHDSRLPLAGVLDACEGQFICDAWGIGDGWDGQELLRIARRLHGSADAVREESALPGEYEKLMHRLLAKSVPELVIRVAPAPGTEVRYLKQVFPTEMELVGSGPETGDGGPGRDGGRYGPGQGGGRYGPGQGGGRYDFATRAWGNETRRYQLCLSADPTDHPRREDLQLAVVDLHVPGSEARLPSPQPCVVHWTDDPALSQGTDDQVEHFGLYQQLGQAVAAAYDAYGHGDHDRAQQHLGRVAALAYSVGAQQQLAELERLVEIVDAASGRVRLRPDLAPIDFQHLITASSRSTYGPGPSGRAGPGTGPGAGTATGTAGPLGALAPCPACHEPVPLSVRFCPVCGDLIEGRP
jgi:hypothetical protein